MRKLDMIPDIRIEELPLPYTAVAVDLNAPFPYSPHFPPGSEREHSMEAHLKGSPNQRIRSLLQKWDEMFGHRLPGKEKIGYFDLIMRSVQLMQHRLTTYALARTPPDVLIQISKDCATVFEFYRAEELIQYGRVVCAEALDRFEESQGRGGSV